MIIKIIKGITYLVTALIIFIIVYAIAMGLLNDICNCANDYALTNLWR